MTTDVGCFFAALALSAALGAQTPCAWSNLGTGLPSPQDRIEAMVLFDDGSGLALYAAGGFTNVSGTPANSVAKWDGNAWTAVGGGFVGSVIDLCVFDDGTGPALYAAGALNGFSVRRWTGSTWAPVSGGSTPAIPASALAVFDDGSGPTLYATTIAGGLASLKIVRWNGATWSPVGTGTIAGVGWTLAVIEDGSGPALYAGGSFASIGGVPAFNLARWDGTTWSAVGSNSPVLEVRAIAQFDDGTGPAMYVGGLGNPPMNGIARWDGTSWNPLGSGLGPVPVNFPPFFVEPTARALAVFDDGGGPALYVGGTFPTAGGVTAPGFARWNGSAWAGSAGSGSGGTTSFALEVFDDGTGPALFAGGPAWSWSGINANGIARYACNSASLSLSASQNGSGTPVFLANANLQPEREYYNLFSLDICPDGPGSGPATYLGLCVNTSANLAFLTQQLLLPVGAQPFHFVATTSYSILGPYVVGPITVDALCIEVTPTGIGSASQVRRLVVQ